MSVLQWIQLSLFGSAPEPIQAASPKVQAPPPAIVKPALLPPEASSSEVWQTALLCAAKPIRLQFAQRGSSSWSLQWGTWAGSQLGRGEPGLTLRLPPTLKAPPLDIAQSLIAWAILVSRRRRNSESKIEKKRLENRIREFLDQQLKDDVQWKVRENKRAHRRLEKLNPKGKFHDLRDCFNAINQEYFEGALQVEVTWSTKLGGLSTHCEKQGPDGLKYHLITISQGYDAPDVTPEILGGVMYHECLHAVYPPVMVNQRRVVHGRDFKMAERKYRHFDIWMHWHRHGLLRSLRSLRRQKKH